MPSAAAICRDYDGCACELASRIRGARSLGRLTSYWQAWFARLFPRFEHCDEIESVELTAYQHRTDQRGAGRNRCGERVSSTRDDDRQSVGFGIDHSSDQMGKSRTDCQYKWHGQ